MDKRDSFIFYRSFYESINALPPENQLEIYQAIFEYSLDFTTKELDGVSKAIFTLIKPQLDANNKKFINGLKGAKYGHKGGRPKEEKTPKKPLKNPKLTPNVNVNVNVNDNVNDNPIPNKSINPPTPHEEEKKEKGVLKQSFKEKGSWSINDVLCQLDDEAERKVKENAPSWCIDLLASKYIQWINNGKRSPPDNVKKAFPAWCGTYTKGKTPF